jgi:hypothetical protein
MAGEGGSGEDGVCGCCGGEVTCLRGEGEGCQVRQRRGVAARSEVGVASRRPSVKESMEIMDMDLW